MTVASRSVASLFLALTVSLFVPVFSSALTDAEAHVCIQAALALPTNQESAVRVCLSMYQPSSNTTSPPAPSAFETCMKDAINKPSPQAAMDACRLKSFPQFSTYLQPKTPSAFEVCMKQVLAAATSTQAAATSTQAAMDACRTAAGYSIPPTPTIPPTPMVESAHRACVEQATKLPFSERGNALFACFNLGNATSATTGSTLTDDTPSPLSDAINNAFSQGAYCPKLVQTLTQGMRDSQTVPTGQVTELQMFLTDYYDLNPDDYVTGFFGRLTHTNVVRFQREQGLPSFGIVGTLTRAAIARVCGGTSTNTNTNSNTGGTIGNPPPAPFPAPANPLFSIGDRVRATDVVNVRQSPQNPWLKGGILLGNQPTGSLGTIIGGAAMSDGHVWWNINWDTGPDGWSAQNYMQKVASTVSIRPRPRAAAPDRACRCLRALPRQSGGLRILFTCRLPSPR